MKPILKGVKRTSKLASIAVTHDIELLDVLHGRVGAREGNDVDRLRDQLKKESVTIESDMMTSFASFRTESSNVAEHRMI